MLESWIYLSFFKNNIFLKKLTPKGFNGSLVDQTKGICNPEIMIGSIFFK
jgi:hypothetical protein